MSEINNVTCRYCDKPSGHGRRISRRGICNWCAKTRITDAAKAMQQRKGHDFEKWVAASVATAQKYARQLNDGV